MTDRSLLAPQVLQELAKYRVCLEVDADGDPLARMAFAHDGEWLKYSDVAAALSRLGGPQVPELCGHSIADRETDASVECSLPKGHSGGHDYSEIAACGRMEP